jgi:hypothetical protein
MTMEDRRTSEYRPPKAAHIENVRGILGRHDGDCSRCGAWGTRAFTDPALNVGGGLRVNVNQRLMLRPDARALVVFADGETHTLFVFVVHVANWF